ncbi:MAG: DegT/DnrJ/EryC1/StrS family aminotransferase [Chromatiaceae bacterium]|nr:DegT/DnrJ/EryC1/StrS family aminotransferase [Chromatiaceae bacterium]
MIARPNVKNQQSQGVPLLDLKAQYASIEQEVMDVVAEVCVSQKFILGANVSALEKRVAEYSQCQFGIGVSSGTDALLVALMALEVGPGDEVITSPYTFFATGGAVARLCARPLFCDIDPATYNLSPAAVENLIREIGDLRNGELFNRKTGGRIKVLLPVHLFGQVADMAPLLEIAKANGLKVVEDAAQAIGAEYSDGQRAGSMGDIGCFSFFPSKNLGAFGDGGMCTTNDPLLAERLKTLRAHGAKPKYYHAVIGGNFRLDEIQAAILLVKLKYLDQWTAGRQENAAFYDQAFKQAGLSDHVSTPKVMPGYRHIYNQYVIRAQNRDSVKKHLTDAQIGNEVYYPVPLHTQQCFAHLGYQEGDCAESSRAARETVAIPIYPELTDAQQQHVVDVIAAFYR